jgi:ferritin-like metal-binding protein YciE
VKAIDAILCFKTDEKLNKFSQDVDKVIGNKVMMTNKNQAVSNLEYDLLTILKNKVEAVQAYDIYLQDAQQAGSQPCAELIGKLQQQEIQNAQEVRQHLQEVMQKGKM